VKVMKYPHIHEGKCLFKDVKCPRCSDLFCYWCVLKFWDYEILQHFYCTKCLDYLSGESHEETSEDIER